MFSKLNYNNQQQKEDGQPSSMKHSRVSQLQREVPRGLMDMPNQGASTSNMMFNRQDSLALAASYQQRDRERFPVDFMETELDLDNYLQCFTDLDVPADNVDLDDTELQKVNLLYDVEPVYDHPPMNGYERHITYGSAVQKPHEFDSEGYKMNCEIKMEPEESFTRRAPKRPPAFEQYDQDYTEESSGEEISDSPSADDSYYEPKGKKRRTTLEKFRPQTRARKYNLKPDEEKAEPTYKLKRARNNDAVRKSRNKAKELQKKKDNEHDVMKRRIAELEGQLESEKEARRRDKELIESLLRNSHNNHRQPTKEHKSERHPLGSSRNFNK